MWKRSKAWRWLIPGMRVKRYAFLAFLGALLAAWGLSPLFPPPPWPLALLLLGGSVATLGIRAMNRSLLSAITEPEEVPERVYIRRRLEQGPRVVAFGGGKRAFPGP